MAAEFQVTTHLFLGAARMPAVSYQTIFQGSKVYDVATTHPRRATIIDYGSRTITMLDPQRQVKLQMSTQQVLEHSAYFKAHGEFRGPLLQFLRDPSFNVTQSPDAQTLTLDGGPLRYDVAVQAVSDQAAVDEYGRFCDWSAQLNFICAGGDPPQARIDLNNHLRSRGMVPREIRKTIRNPNPADNVTLRTSHDFRWQLDATDTALVQSIEQDLKQAKAVDFPTFVRVAFAR